MDFLNDSIKAISILQGSIFFTPGILLTSLLFSNINLVSKLYYGFFVVRIEAKTIQKLYTIKGFKEKVHTSIDHTINEVRVQFCTIRIYSELLRCRS